jgi:hypothetical protein
VVDGFNTFSPYRFSGTQIIESFDMFKPFYNFAGLTDENYPESSTFYNRIYKKYITDTYNENTHILTASLFLDDTIDIYNIYNYHNTNYILKSINEYDPTEPDLYEVELLRVNDVDNYIVPPTPTTYDNSFQFVVDSYFNGDITSNSASLLGFDQTLYRSSNGGAYSIVESYSTVLDSIVYNGGTDETKLTTTHTKGQSLDFNIDYRYKVLTNFHYLRDTVDTPFVIWDSIPVLVNNNNSSGTIVNQNQVQQLILTSADQPVTEPILIYSFKKVSIEEGIIGYKVVLYLDIVSNGSNELDNLTTSVISAYRLTGGPFSSTYLATADSIVYSDSPNGGVGITITLETGGSYTPGYNINDFNAYLVGEDSAHWGGNAPPPMVILIPDGYVEATGPHCNMAADLVAKTIDNISPEQFDSITNNGTAEVSVLHLNTQINYINTIQ